MKTNTIKKTILIFALAVTSILATVPAFAGNEGAHGGSGVVCRDPNNKKRILSVELLDLFEGENQFGFTITRDNKTLEMAQAYRAIAKIDFNSRLKELLDETVEDVRQRLILTKTSDIELISINDSHAILRKNNCKLEQIAVYDNFGNIALNTSIYAKMSKTDRAALILHEAIYKIDREQTGTTNSIRARAAVAKMFSDVQVDLTSVVADLAIKQGVYSAYTSDPRIMGTEFFVRAEKNNNLNVWINYPEVDPNSGMLTHKLVKFTCNKSYTKCYPDIYKYVGNSRWYVNLTLTKQDGFISFEVPKDNCEDDEEHKSIVFMLARWQKFEK